MTAKSNGIISIIIPVHNEQDNIRPLYDRLCASLDRQAHEVEIIFIDDGSGDGTLEQIDKLGREDERVKYLILSRNFGHQAALTAGMDFARGDAVICMDGDLQHPPEFIPKLIEHWQAGNDIVYTIRKSTEGISLFKKATAAIFYWIINRLSIVEIESNASDFRLIDRKVADVLKRHRERKRFHRGMVKWVGFKQKALEFDADVRHSGQSSYSLVKMMLFAIDGLLAYSHIPVALIVFFSVCVTSLAIFYLLFVLYSRFVVGDVLPGQTGILLSILLIGMVQMISTSVVAIYAYRNFQESRGLPPYVLLRSKGFDD